MKKTPNGIPYDMTVSGPHECHFVLYPENQDGFQIEIAKAYLRREHDVVSIKIERNYS